MRLAPLACSGLALLVFAGCDRPLVDPLQRPIEVVGVDLGEVQTDPTLRLGLRVQGATAVTVDGSAATLDAALGVFVDTLTLARGINRIAVRASDASGVVGVDTLVALYLPIVAGTASSLPSARTEAAVAAVPIDRVLVTGGVGPGGALASMAVLTPVGPGFTATEAPLLTPRAGHTASALPDGGVLLVGGASAETPARATDFVSTVEWIPPGSVQSQTVALPFGGTLRADHTARVLEASGRVLIYLYGGLVPAGTGVAESGTVDIFEWLPRTMQFARLSPPGGAGSFPATSGHVQIPLDDGTTAGRAADVVFGEAPALRFDFTAPGFNFPFDVSTRDAAPLSVPRTDAAGASLGPGLALVVGGRDAAGTPLGSLEVYASEVDQTFRVPAGTGLSVPRFGAGATLLPDSRIIVVGGRASSRPTPVIDVLSLVPAP